MEIKYALFSFYMQQFHHEPEHTFDPLPDEGKDRSDIVAELKAWKEQHEV